MSRPEYQRALSTSLGRNTLVRPLEGKLAIITGGSRGIGAAVARNLATKGASVVLNYTSDSSAEKATALASELQSTHNIRAITVQADMGDPDGPEHIVTTAKINFAHPKTGKFQIDIIVNNAGISGNAPLGEINPGEFHTQYSVNVLGPALLVQAALPYLPNDRSGRIVNLSSVSSTMGAKNQTVYGGTKAALEAMTRTWSRELAERATVNAVNPGPVATDMYEGTSEEFRQDIKPFLQNAPLARTRQGIDADEVVKNEERTGGRAAYDHEIAGVIAMLCTEDSGWCTGSVICANGGMRFSI